MTKYVPPSFDRARVIEGLQKAMGFGEPTRDADKTTFYFETVAASPDARDEEDVPFNPSKKRATTTTHKAVTCALEYDETSLVVNEYGVSQPASVTVTLLDDEYQLVKGFTFVTAGGDRYFYEKTEPPTGLGSLDVWTVHCNARDTT